MVDNSPRFASELPSIDDCSDDAMLARSMPLPESKASRERIFVLEAQLDEARRAMDDGHIERAIAEAELVLDESRKLDESLMIGRALWLLGKLEARRNPPLAESLLREAIEKAAIAGDPSTEAAAWMELLNAIGRGGSRLKEVLTLEQAALVAVRRAGSNRSEGQLQMTVAGVLGANGDYQAALERFEKARAITAIDKPAMVPIIDHNMANVLVSLHRFDEAKTSFARAIEGLASTYHPNHISVGTARVNVAGILVNQEDFDAAEKELDAAKVILESNLPKEDELWVGYLRARSDIAEARGDTDEAWAQLKRAAEMSAAVYGEHTIAHSYLLESMAMFLANGDRFDEALIYANQAVEAQEQALGPKHAKRAPTLALRGRLHAWLGHPDEAMADFQSVLELAPETLAGARARFGVLKIRGRSSHGAKSQVQQVVDYLRRESTPGVSRDVQGESEIAAEVEAWFRGK